MILKLFLSWEAYLLKVVDLDGSAFSEDMITRLTAGADDLEAAELGAHPKLIS